MKLYYKTDGDRFSNPVPYSLREKVDQMPAFILSKEESDLFLLQTDEKDRLYKSMMAYGDSTARFIKGDVYFYSITGELLLTYHYKR